ncbi:hypothetical protein [Nannocystis pusilla]|uniref:hypothetical protein n=1 Tax=Nannocystis pusilla TaxID=889268 RepID=UPI003DA604DE
MFVARLMADTRDAVVLRSLAAELTRGLMDERDVTTELAAALVSGRLVLTRRGQQREVLVGGSAEVEAKPHDDNSFEMMEAGPPTHWVEIELVDEDGEGIPGQPYLIVTPDGVERRGFTDSLGSARVSRIPAGVCEVFFPELDAGAWESAAQAVERKSAEQAAAARNAEIAAQRAAAAKSQPAVTRAAETVAPTHWLEIQLVDEDGEGIAGQSYLIVAPDGGEWRGRTDEAGVARLSPVPAGICQVSFPDLDAEAWVPV